MTINLYVNNWHLQYNFDLWPTTYTFGCLSNLQAISEMQLIVIVLSSHIENYVQYVN